MPDATAHEDSNHEREAVAQADVQKSAKKCLVTLHAWAQDNLPQKVCHENQFGQTPFEGGSDKTTIKAYIH
jgi:hypothetical protein